MGFYFGVQNVRQLVEPDLDWASPRGGFLGAEVACRQGFTGVEATDATLARLKIDRDETRIFLSLHCSRLKVLNTAM